MTEAREILGRIALFSEVLSDRQLDDLAAKSRMVDVPEGMVLLAEGDFGSSMFAIAAGTFEVSVAGARHPHRNVAILGPGEIVGEMSLMTGARRAATVVCKTPARVLEITKVALEALFSRTPELLDQLGVVLAKRQAELDKIADDEQAPRVLGIRTDDIVQSMRRFFFMTG